MIVDDDFADIAARWPDDRGHSTLSEREAILSGNARRLRRRAPGSTA